MKKLFILVAIVTISTSAFAQFGITGGATISSFKLEIDDPDITTKSIAGFTLGVFTDIPMSTNFILRPGLNYTQKGVKVIFTGTESDETTRRLNFVELPLDLIYKTTGGFFVGAGPAVAYVMSGKDSYSDDSDDYKLKIGSDENNDDVKPLEFSGNLLAGYQLSKGIFFSVNYNMGFSNLSPIKGDDEAYKTRYFGIKIGKKFGVAKK